MESSTELIRTLDQLNISLREGKSLEVSLRTLEAIAGFKAQLESLLQGRKWRNAVERIWSFGPRRSGSCGLSVLQNRFIVVTVAILTWFTWNIVLITDRLTFV